jgi:hypothetical protein
MERREEIGRLGFGRCSFVDQIGAITVGYFIVWIGVGSSIVSGIVKSKVGCETT